jgi:hypothetical protein
MRSRLLFALAVLVTMQALLIRPAWSQDGAVAPVSRGGPAPRHFYTDRWWWVGRAVSGAAVTVDAASTMTAARACPGCVEDSYLFSYGRPTPGRTAARAGLGFGISTVFAIAEWWVMRRAPRRNPWTIGSYVDVPITDGVVHGWAAEHNYALASDCRRAVLVCK